MDCTLMKDELLAYHFGTSERAAEADTHLLECKDCLGAYLALKRAIESEAHADERPSNAVRLRVRAEAERLFRPSLLVRFGKWLARPVPRYQTVAFAALAAVVLLVITVNDAAPPKPPSHGQLVDSARQAPESIVFY